MSKGRVIGSKPRTSGEAQGLGVQPGSAATGGEFAEWNEPSLNLSFVAAMVGELREAQRGPRGVGAVSGGEGPGLLGVGQGGVVVVEEPPGQRADSQRAAVGGNPTVLLDLSQNQCRCVPGVGIERGGPAVDEGVTFRIGTCGHQHPSRS